MRIIEPHQLRKSSRNSGRRRYVTIGAVSLVLAGAVAVFWMTRGMDNSLISSLTPVSVSPTPVPEQQPEDVEEKPRKIREFAPDEFRNLYQNLAYPNIQEITITTRITDSVEADAKIIEIAERRGYRRTSVPVAPIVKINEPLLEGDDLLQPKAFEGWKELKALAAEDGIPLRLLSAYRSIDYQRTLFTQRLYANGATVEAIVAGRADAAIEKTLQLTAPPGYSRHHTGYTVDLMCDPGYFVQFADSICYRWISADNYEKAKLTGWVPSYPAGTTNQGPEPEPWEYVWVGHEAVTE